jgi:hypothetical protein
MKPQKAQWRSCSQLLSPLKFLLILSALSPVSSLLAGPFEVALDGAGMTWSQDASGTQWQVQTGSPSHDAADSMVLFSNSSVTSSPYSAALNTTVQGPGVLRYWVYDSLYYGRLDVVGSFPEKRDGRNDFSRQWHKGVVYLPSSQSHTVGFRAPSDAFPTYRMYLDEVSYTPTGTLSLADALDQPGLSWTTTGTSWMAVAGPETTDGDYAVCSKTGTEDSNLATTIRGPAFVNFRCSGLDASVMECRLDGALLTSQLLDDALWAKFRLVLPEDKDYSVRWSVRPQNAGDKSLMLLDSVSVEAQANAVTLEQALDRSDTWTMGPREFMAVSGPSLGRSDNDAAFAEIPQGTFTANTRTQRLNFNVNGAGSLQGWVRIRSGSTKIDLSTGLDRNYFTTPNGTSLISNRTDYLVPSSSSTATPNVAVGQFTAWVPFRIRVNSNTPTVTLYATHSADYTYNLASGAATAAPSQVFVDDVSFIPDVPVASLTLPGLQFSSGSTAPWTAQTLADQNLLLQAGSATDWLECTVTGPGDFTCRTAGTLLAVDGQAIYTSMPTNTFQVVDTALRVHVGSGSHMISFRGRPQYGTYSPATILQPIFTPGAGLGGALNSPESSFVLVGTGETQSTLTHDGNSAVTLAPPASTNVPTAVLYLVQPTAVRGTVWQNVDGTWQQRNCTGAGVIQLGKQGSVDEVALTAVPQVTTAVAATAAGVTSATSSSPAAKTYTGSMFLSSPVLKPTSEVFSVPYETGEQTTVVVNGPGALVFKTWTPTPFTLSVTVAGNEAVRVADGSSAQEWRDGRIELPGAGENRVVFDFYASGVVVANGVPVIDGLQFIPSAQLDLSAAVGLPPHVWMSSGVTSAEVVTDASANGGSYARFLLTNGEGRFGASWSFLRPRADWAARLRYRNTGTPFNSLTFAGNALPWSAAWRTVEIRPNAELSTLAALQSAASVTSTVEVDQIEFFPHTFTSLASALDSAGITWQSNITLSDPSGASYPPTGTWFGWNNGLYFGDGDGAILDRVLPSDLNGGSSALLKGTVSSGPGTLTWWWRLHPGAEASFNAFGPGNLNAPRSATLVQASARITQPDFFWTGKVPYGANYSPNNVIYLDRVVFIPDSAQSTFAAWSAEYLPALTPEPSRDTDGDGMSDLAEYALGGEPNNAGVSGRPLPVMRNGQFHFSWRQRKGAAFAYAPEFSSNLQSWAPPAQQPSITSLDAIWEEAKVVITPPANQPVYGRLKLRSTP